MLALLKREPAAQGKIFVLFPGTSVPGYSLWRFLRGLIMLRYAARGSPPRHAKRASGTPDLHPATRSRVGDPGACGARNEFWRIITADLKVCSTPFHPANLEFAAAFLADFLLDIKANKW